MEVISSLLNYLFSWFYKKNWYIQKKIWRKIQFFIMQNKREKIIIDIFSALKSAVSERANLFDFESVWKLSSSPSRVLMAAIKETKNKFFTAYAKKVSELMEEYLNNIKLFCVLWNHRVELNFMCIELAREKSCFLSIHNITNLLLLIHS